jgi:GNAT superfamily N-acetyltransferase
MENERSEAMTLRFATADDIPLILDFIRRLAAYEKLEDRVEATEETLREHLFGRDVARAMIAEAAGMPVGYAVYFYNYSTFTGRTGIYLEDLFVLPEMRKKGFGRKIITAIAKRAAEEGCGRMEWSCLAWNEPSRKFYRGLGADEISGWGIFRLDRGALVKMAAEN